jgi:hypothetical protein
MADAVDADCPAAGAPKPTVRMTTRTATDANLPTERRMGKTGYAGEKTLSKLYT